MDESDEIKRVESLDKLRGGRHVGENSEYVLMWKQYNYDSSHEF